MGCASHFLVTYGSRADTLLWQNQWLRDAGWGDLQEEELSSLYPPPPGLESSGPGWQPCVLSQWGWLTFHASSSTSVKWVYQCRPRGQLVEGDGEEVLLAVRLWSVLSLSLCPPHCPFPCPGKVTPHFCYSGRIIPFIRLLLPRDKHRS